MKILYLFNRIKKPEVERINNGEEHDNHCFGMLRLKKFGLEADYLEIEQFYPAWLANFLRRHLLGLHYAHLPLLPKFFSYDIIFTSSAFGSLLVKSLLGIKKPKWVVFDYNISGTIGDKSTFKQKIFNLIISKVDGVITLAPREVEVMQAMFPRIKNKISFIPLGVDLEFFQPRLEIAEEDFILSVGRDPFRDYRTLFEAVKDETIRLKVTARQKRLEKFQPLPQNVEVCDFSPKGLVDQYARAKLAVITLAIKPGSENDTMGLSSLLEAMAMGKAAIATRTATTETYIQDGVNGILVPPHDARELKRQISALLEDDEKRRRLGKAAREFVEKNCSADQFAESLAGYFKKLQKYE